MRVSELFSGMDVTVTGRDVDVACFAHDSRKVASGALFSAWKGTQNDGHQFIDDAIAAGAVAILHEDDIVCDQLTTIQTPNARVILALAASRFYEHPGEQLTLVGVTGTNGKTSVTHLVAALLGQGYRPGVIGTLGAHYEDASGGVHAVDQGLTTPDAVALQMLLRDMLQAGTTAVAMEVSSHALVQSRVMGVLFDVAVFTNLTRDHLDMHGTMDAYFDAKRQLFSSYIKPKGVAVINLDDGRADALMSTLGDVHCITYSAMGNLHADLYLTAHQFSTSGTKMDIMCAGAQLSLASPLLGSFNIENTLAALGVGLALDLPSADTIKRLQGVTSIPGRLERVSGQGEPLVLVDYAHTPDALRKALLAVEHIGARRIVCVFGCGGNRDRGKRATMGEIAATYADEIVVTSDNPRTENPEDIIDAIGEGIALVPKVHWHRECDRKRAIDMAIREASDADVVLIAGKGHETEQVIGTQRHPFDDRLIAKAALRKWRSKEAKV